MIDYRYNTFLTLCEVMNFTRTAEVLHMTQPAVTQHIHYLEELYECKLFVLKGKRIYLTEKGEKLRDYTIRINADSILIKEAVKNSDHTTNFTFGATLTIGEFVMPPFLSDFIDKKIKANMLVQNTENLLNKLKSGDISFALIEGYFDKASYGYKLFREEDFIGICNPKSTLSKKQYTLDSLFNNRLIIRESGSGTRDILEQALYEKNISLASFDDTIEIGNMTAIKELIKHNNGISFVYKCAVEKELKSGEISQIDITDFNIKREFNFVYLKNSVNKEYILNNINKFFK